MAYSGGSHAKVQFHPTANGTIECYVFDQNTFPSLIQINKI